MSDCPKCGCNDTRKLPKRRSGFNWGAGREGHTPKERRICNACGAPFSAEVPLQTRPEPELQTRPEIGVTYQTPVVGGATCPGCGHHPWPVTRTLKADGGPRIRHHKCPECGETGKSAE